MINKPHSNAFHPEEVLKALNLVDMAAANCHAFVICNNTWVGTAAIDEWQIHLKFRKCPAHTISIDNR